eukprot:GFKZ01006155.1.p1 GENE.GFKZ01006155.1~~GFKZ01006155.1.p1  ORF type:complete len:2081 (+),score=200.83 GFKZ01006155.1:101-6343(+)
MGRVDLSRYRAYALSNTPPVPLPHSLAHTEQQISEHPSSPVTHAIIAFRDASTQRDQVQAIKRLGHSLRDARTKPPSSPNYLPPYYPTTLPPPQTPPTFLHTVAASLLSDILFETPSATGSLAAAALKAILQCHPAPLHSLDNPIRHFLQRLEAYASTSPDSQHTAVHSPASLTSYFPSASADVAALSTILSQPQASQWVLAHPPRVLGALCLIALPLRLFSLVFDSETSAEPRNPHLDPPSVVQNITAVERACDSAVKAAQDILAYVIKAADDSCLSVVDCARNQLQQVVDCCTRLLEMPALPRSCALACAAVCVSGLLHRHGNHRTPVHVAAVLHQHLIPSVPRFPRFSQLSLLRAVMEAPAARPALTLVLYPPKDGFLAEAGGRSWRLGECVFDQLVGLTRTSADVHLRFMAMEALVTCVRRRSPLKLHSQDRDTVLQLVYERLHEPIPGISAQVREAMEALVSVDGGDDESTQFWIAKTQALLKNGWLSRGIYAPLGVLVGRIGALPLLQAEPLCQSLAMNAAGIDARLAKPVADFMTNFWKELRVECCRTGQSYDRITLDPLARALVDRNSPQLRERVSEQMIPAYFRAAGMENVTGSAERLLRKIDEVTTPGSTLRMRGTITILSSARAIGVSVRSFSDPVICGLVNDALCSSSEDIRSSALDLVVTSKATTAPPSVEEFQLLQSHLPIAMMPACSASYRSRFRHSMRRLCERLAACRHSARDGSGGWWVRERKMRFDGIRTDAFEKFRLLVLNRMNDFEKNCWRAVLFSAYPGAPFGRRTSAMNLANLLSSNLGFQISARLKLPSPAMHVSSLLGCMLDEWERPRRAAMEVMSSISDPTPGFECVEDILELQAFALQLILSPRQREVDSGAALYRFIFQKHAIAMQNVAVTSRGPLVLFTGDVGEINVLKCKSKYSDPGLTYAESVLDSLEARTNHAESSFYSTCKSGLFHGHCLFIRYIVQDLKWRGMSSAGTKKSYSYFVKRLVNLYKRCTNLAMRGINYSAMGDDFQIALGGDDDHHALPLNEKNIFMEESKQVVSTSCFLSVKEICVSLGILCHEIMSGLHAESESDVISTDELKSIGDLYLHIFTNTRHWGVIDGASEGLQLLCEQLLQSPEKERRDLPREWIANTLSLSLNGKLYVLRRSAGVPYLICSIVNAEAALLKHSYGSPLLHNVITTLLAHLENTHMFTRDLLLDETRSRKEEGVAHALNLLRALYLNGRISTPVLNHLESTTMNCIKAFGSASWLIRNSALMLFSALVRRGVGVCLERKAGETLSSFEVAGGTSATLDGERRLNGVTAIQFFARYPKLHPFLLNELVHAVKRHDLEESEDHPALFPTLYLLSSLSPSIGEDPSVMLSMNAFRSVLLDCVHWRSNYVRRAAAAACVPLVEDPSQVAQVMDNLLKSAIPAIPETGLGLDGEQESCPNSSTWKPRLSTKVRTYALRQNHLHGDLLTVTAILDGMSRAMNLSHKAEIIKRMAVTLPHRLWVAKGGHVNPCSVTRSSMVLLMYKVYDMAREVEGVNSTLEECRRSSRAVIDMSAELGASLRRFDDDVNAPETTLGFPAFQGHSASFIVHVTISSLQKKEISPTVAVENVKPLIFCDTREVLLEGLGAINRIYMEYVEDSKQRYLFSPASLLDVWTRCQRLIENCRYQDIIVSAVRLMTTLLSQDDYLKIRSSGTSEKGIELAKTNIAQNLLDTLERHNCVDIRENGIIFIGRLMKTNVHHTQLLSRWIHLLELMTSGTQPPSSKVAACVSFDRSALGSKCWSFRGNVFVAERAVQGLLRISAMTEDGNLQVRTTALQVLHRCTVIAQTNDYALDTLPTLMSLFKLLSAHFSNLAFLLRYMSSFLGTSSYEQDVLMSEMGVENEVQSTLDTDPLRKSGSPVPINIIERKKSSRIFRLEEDSDESEVVLRMQLLSWCYREAILSSSLQRKYVEKSSDIAMRMVRELNDSLEVGRRNYGKSVLDSETFTGDGFVRCYRCVLRVFLAVSFLQAEKHGPKEPDKEERRAGVQHAKAKVAKYLTCAVGGYQGEVHPVLLLALDGIRELLTEQQEPPIIPLQKVLFLLRLQT